MIATDYPKVKSSITTNLALPATYQSLICDKVIAHRLSPTARKVLYTICPTETGRYISSHRPEVTALRLLDYLSSKQGYIRRKGQSFRKESVYLAVLPLFLKAIRAEKPIILSGLCLCTTLANRRYVGESPYPHMAAYIAFENLQKIALAAKAIYPNGVRFVLGYEGTLFQPLYFQSEAVINNTLTIFNELNDTAYNNVTSGLKENPLQIVDAMWMIEQAFNDKEAFYSCVEENKKRIQSESLAEWKLWYEKTVSEYYFPPLKERRAFVDEKARWREAVSQLKYSGGPVGRGFVQFNDEVIPFTPAGRRSNMIALQMVPENSYLPHQRAMTYNPATSRWRMMAYEDIQKAETSYVPCFVDRFSYPFYFEKV